MSMKPEFKPCRCGNKILELDVKMLPGQTAQASIRCMNPMCDELMVFCSYTSVNDAIKGLEKAWNGRENG